MRERWEYLTVVWVYSAKKLSQDPAKHEFAFKKDLFIWHPGAGEADVRPLWSSADADVVGNCLDVLNELGAEGWELVTEVVMDSTVGPREDWGEVGYPVRQRWLFKRRAESAGA